MDKNFIKKRNETMATKDKNKIIAYCEEYGIEIPENEEVFWAGVHKCVCNLFLNNDSNISLESYNESYDWLERHGYNPSVVGGKK